jgi:hypothetical protein
MSQDSFNAYTTGNYFGFVSHVTPLVIVYTIYRLCLPDDKMASAEAGQFASLSEEDFEFNLVDQFFKLVRIVVKTWG